MEFTERYAELQILSEAWAITFPFCCFAVCKAHSQFMSLQSTGNSL